MTTVITAKDPAFTDAKYGTYALIKSLKADIDDTLKVLEKTEPKDVGLINDLVALSADVVAAANAWEATELALLTTKAKELNGRYDSYRLRVPLVQGFAASTGENVLSILIGISVLFGGIIVSHLFIDSSVSYRIFYFIYGAALFPVSLAVGVWNPPLWRATILPLMEGTNSLFSFTKPDADDEPSSTLRWISLSLIILSLVFYTALYRRLPV